MKNMLICYRGLPGSGKTTAAKAAVKNMNDCRIIADGKAIRVNRDDTRMMLFGRKTGLDFKDEELVTKVCHNAVRAGLKAGKYVYVDDTNLRVAYLKKFRQLANECNADFHVVDMPTSYEECVARNSTRPDEDRVPVHVLENMRKKFMRDGKYLPLPDIEEPKVEPYVPDPKKWPAILVDIDGTVAQMVDRGPFEWSKVGNDEPIENIWKIVNWLWEGSPANILFMSGRDEVCFGETRKWLDRYFWGAGRRPMVCEQDLFMRPEGDQRPDEVVKLELFNKHIRDNYNVIAVLDDRQKVVNMWRSIGLTCLQVAPGDF